jgi:hypothetical protein
MNGMDFDLRIRKPWERDPDYYQSPWTAQSDTPAHEGPTHHAVVDLWTYAFPLSKADEAKLTAEIRTIPSLLAGSRQPDRQRARPLEHRHRHDGAAGDRPRHTRLTRARCWR